MAKGFRKGLEKFTMGFAGGFLKGREKEIELKTELAKEQMKRRMFPEDVQLKQAQIAKTRSEADIVQRRRNLFMGGGMPTSIETPQVAPQEIESEAGDTTTINVRGKTPPPDYINNPNFLATGEGDPYIENPEADIYRKEQAEKRKGLPAESAGKATMVKQALSDLEEVENLLFITDNKGKKQLIHGLAFGANVPGGTAFGIGRVIPDVNPWTSAETRTKVMEIASRMNNALEAKLRIETGAAATQEEFNRLKDRFGITGFDTTESALDKIERLKDFMKNASITIDPIGKFVYKSKDKKLERELNNPILTTPSGASFSYKRKE